MSKQTLHDNTPVKAEFSIPAQDLPTQARVVIIGGGIAGVSVAYHLGRAGWDNVVLLEQNQISSGTTWHAAGMVGQLRSSSAQTKVNKASVQIYSQLLADTGHDPGWLQCGGLQLAACQERMYQLQRNAAMAEVYGVEVQTDHRGSMSRLLADVEHRRSSRRGVICPAMGVCCQANARSRLPRVRSSEASESSSKRK